MDSVYETDINQRINYKITKRVRVHLTDLIWGCLYMDKLGGEEFLLSQKEKFKHPSNYEGKRNCCRKSGIIQQGVRT